MNIFVFLITILAVAAAQKCTDEALVKKFMTPLVEKCKKSLGTEINALSEEEKHEKMLQCIFDEEGMFKADGFFDIEKYKTNTAKYLTADMKAKVLKTIRKVWFSVHGNVLEFDRYLHAELKEICPEDKYYCSEEEV